MCNITRETNIELLFAWRSVFQFAQRRSEDEDNYLSLTPFGRVLVMETSIKILITILRVYISSNHGDRIDSISSGLKHAQWYI